MMHIEEEEKPLVWDMNFNGASSIKPAKPPNIAKAWADIGLIFITLERGIMRYSFGLMKPKTNNEAKYEALVAGLEIIISIGI